MPGRTQLAVARQWPLETRRSTGPPSACRKSSVRSGRLATSWGWMSAPLLPRRLIPPRARRPSVAAASSLAQLASRAADDRQLAVLARRFGLRVEAVEEWQVDGAVDLAGLRVRRARPSVP